jgi:hypothetical protein
VYSNGLHLSLKIRVLPEEAARQVLMMGIILFKNKEAMYHQTGTVSFEF